MCGGVENATFGESVGPIGSALATISSLEVDALGAEHLANAVLQVERLLNAVHALSADLLRRFEQHGGWAAEGALSAPTWTAERTGSSRGALRSRLRQGAAMVRLPTVAADARAGRWSPEQLRAVSDCARHYLELASAHEAVFVEQAAALDAQRFRLATRHWLAIAADAAGPGDPHRPADLEAESHLHATRTFEGWLRIDGLLAPRDADLVEAALGAGVDRALRAAHDGDPSAEEQSVSALRAAALVDLAAQSMRHEPSDASVPDRYRVAVIVRPSEEVVPAEAACDAVAYRVTLGVRAEVLDVGRQTARWPTAIRRAITVRDGGCVFPGCDRPPSWTDIHHCTPWAECGATAVDNGALLCRRHHTFVHRHRWRITIDRGLPTTRRPDGTPFVIRRWHAHAPVA